jgi:short subunit dehydrogenase-like uncharacterized protein
MARTGYAGALVVAELLAAGVRPVLAERSREALERVARPKVFSKTIPRASGRSVG